MTTASKNLGEMINKADNVKKTGRAVHSEAIYTALLLKHLECKNLYIFFQRDMCLDAITQS